jgi:hypothetical protein
MRAFNVAGNRVAGHLGQISLARPESDEAHEAVYGSSVCDSFQKVADVRNDWQWKQARLLLLAFDLLVFETLNLKAMHYPSYRKPVAQRI